MVSIKGRKQKTNLEDLHARLAVLVCCDEGATLHNNVEVYTRDFMSNGAITGTGTTWAHVSSKHIGGEIAAL